MDAHFPPEIIGFAIGYCDVVSATSIEGRAYDPAAPDVPLVMRVLIDGSELCSVTCDLVRDDFVSAGSSVRQVGFHVAIPKGLPRGGERVIEFRHRDGSPIALQDASGVHQRWVLPKPKRVARRAAQTAVIPTGSAAEIAVGQMNGTGNGAVRESGYDYPDTALAGIDGFHHDLEGGNNEARRPAFDEAWYLQEYPDAASSGLSGHEHYEKFGRSQHRHPCLDATWYVEEYPDVAASGLDARTHYRQIGRFQGRHPGFDTVWYREEYSDPFDGEPLEHYRRIGRASGYHPAFDRRWYILEYPD